MSKFYVLEKNTSEGLDIKLPLGLFSGVALECEELGEEPFTFNTLEEAEEVKNALYLIFAKKISSTEFIIVKEIEWHSKNIVKKKNSPIMF